MSGEEETTIRITVATREKIKHAARKDEKYDDFIKRLLATYDSGYNEGLDD